MTAPSPILSILVATDLTDASATALQASVDLAIVTGARLHVIHGHAEPNMLSGDGDLLSLQREVHAKRADLISTIRGMADRRIEIASARVHVGSPAGIILKEARNVGADLIVLGAHRNRGMAGRPIGSTTEHVVRRSSTPCLVVNRPLALPLARVLVATDLAGDAVRVTTSGLTWADQLCELAVAEVTVAHVADSAVDLGGSHILPPDLQQQLKTTAQEANRGAGCAIPVRTRLSQCDDPAAEISSLASSLEADLVVLGTQGDPTLVRMLLGSVTSAVVRSVELPILLVPPARRAKAVGIATVPTPNMIAASAAM